MSRCLITRSPISRPTACACICAGARCPDLAMLRHTVYLDRSLSDFRDIIAVNVAVLNHAVADLPADRMRMHVCWASTVAPHHTDVPLIDIIDIVLARKPMAGAVP